MDNLFSEQEIDAILNLPEWNLLGQGLVDGSKNVIPEKSIRKSKVSWVYPNKQSAFIWEKLTTAIADINKQFFHFDLTGCYEPMQLSFYDGESAGHYTWHTDSSYQDTQVPRKLSLSVMLSDPVEYEGGQLQIKTESDQAKTLETPKGRIWFFPGYTLHRVAPLTKGTRKSLVLWVGGPAFK
jgi:PKHD-type hydroxylase